MALTFARLAQIAIAVALAGALVALLALGLDLHQTHPALAALVLALYAINALALSAAALTALMGARPQPAPRPSADDTGRCAVLWLICGEDPLPLAARARALLGALDQTGQAASTGVFILSDTPPGPAQRREAEVFAPLAARVTYRHRADAQGRKPGNLRDWLASHGDDVDTMLILDADSGFSGARLKDMRAEMAASPALGLLQAGVRLRPGTSRFARLQRLSARLSGPVFGRGLERLSGQAGNFWGHNALVRIRAFEAAATLPRLSGKAPMGGAILSHDFVEAAFLRRAGWGVRLASDSLGSHEDAPETIATHFRRDRRWAQGNMQHLRVIAMAGLHPSSRLHLLGGIHSYLSAPIWLALVLLFGSGAVHATAGAVWSLVATLALLMVPKAAGMGAMLARWRGRKSAPIWRAFWAELWLSTLFAPLGMVRRTGFLAAILAGRDSGWTPTGRANAPAPRPGRAEALAGLAILGAVIVPQLALSAQGPLAALMAAGMVLPVVLPLLAAPWLIAWFDRPLHGTNAVEAYYDASTRRFLRMGGSGEALAIHRPLWAQGITDVTAASAHVNDLIAEAAFDALGRAPARVCDMGCGVGGTLFHLARLWPDSALVGMTLSAEQVRIASALAKARGLEGRVQILRSDFRLPTTLPRADLLIAVESHVHADSAAEFLRAARLHLAPGGVAIIVDDMPLPRATTDPMGQRLLDAFRRGWRLGHTTPAEGLIDAALAEGLSLHAQSDLTALLRLNRWRDRLLRAFGPVADALGLGRWALFANMIGGNALTEAYRHNLMSYRMLVLRAPEAQVSESASAA